ncbi:MAG: tetratricopeptide repeat protein, partial [Chloroflexia bacterium]
MDTSPSTANAAPTTQPKTRYPIGQRIRRLRHERGLTQEALAAPEFTKGYVSALERGAVRPSLKAMELLAARLGVPITDFLAPPQQLDNGSDLEAVKEDILFQSNYAKMLIRTGQVDEAMKLIDTIESDARDYSGKLPPNVKYMIPFLRGRAYLQARSARQARPELETALAIAEGDQEATARTHNLLGVVFFELDLPQFALEQHLLCLEALHSGAVKDPYFRLAVYRNLASDYWALNDAGHAISMYKEALPILEDLNDMEEQARVFWGMAMAYRMSKDTALAKLYASRALNIYELADNRSEAASTCLNLAEIFMEEQRYEESEQLLERAGRYLTSTGNQALL